MSEPWRIAAQPPLGFRLARAWIASGIRGGYRWFEWLRRRGSLDCAAPLAVDATETMLVPLTWHDVFHTDWAARYEPDAIGRFAAAIDAMPSPPMVIDAGADVGVFARLLLRQTRAIAALHCFEPNARSFALLQHNLETCPVPVTLHPAGLGAISGRASLHFPSDAPGDPAGFLLPDPAGAISLTRLDDLGLRGPVAIKLDIEGGEADALDGAAATLAQAPAFAVQFEAHRDVTARTGIDPTSLARRLAALAPVEIVVCEEKSRSVSQGLDLDRPFFDQFTTAPVYDLVVQSRQEDSHP